MCRELTCTLLDPGSFLEGMAAKLAVEVVLPELGKPDVPAVVVQRAADEVAIKAWVYGGGGVHWSVDTLIASLTLH